MSYEESKTMLKNDLQLTQKSQDIQQKEEEAKAQKDNDDNCFLNESKSIKESYSSSDTPQSLTFSNSFFKKTCSTQELRYNKYEATNEKINNESEDKNSVIKQMIISPWDSTFFVLEEECEGTNIIYTDKKDLFHISFNLFLQKIALDQNFDSTNSLKEGFIVQYPNFITTQFLLDKLINTYDYLLNIYTYGESTKKDSCDSTSTIGSSYSTYYLPRGIISFMNMIFFEKYEKEISQYVHLKERVKSFYTKVSENPLFKSNEEYCLYDIMKVINIPSEYHFDLFLHLSLLKPKKHFMMYRLNYNEKTNITHKGLFHIEDWSSKDVAIYLTSITLTMMNKIDVNELLFGNSCGKDKMTKSPNVMKLIDRFNNLTLFIIEEILSYDKKQKRAEIIEKTIDIAYELKKLHNYNDTMNLKASLNHFIIKSLSQTWQYVKSEYKVKLTKLNEILSIQKTFTNLKKKITKSIAKEKPYIPYLGMILQELSFLEEGNKYIHKKHMMLNASKINNVKKIIDDFLVYRNRLLLLPKIKGLEILSELNPRKECELDELSKTLEPVFTRAKKMEIDKQMTNTDSSVCKYIAIYDINGCISLTNSGIFRIEQNFYE